MHAQQVMPDQARIRIEIRRGIEGPVGIVKITFGRHGLHAAEGQVPLRLPSVDQAARTDLPDGSAAAGPVVPDPAGKALPGGRQKNGPDPGPAGAFYIRLPAVPDMEQIIGTGPQILQDQAEETTCVLALPVLTGNIKAPVSRITAGRQDPADRIRAEVHVRDQDDLFPGGRCQFKELAAALPSPDIPFLQPDLFFHQARRRPGRDLVSAGQEIIDLFQTDVLLTGMALSLHLPGHPLASGPQGGKLQGAAGQLPVIWIQKAEQVGRFPERPSDQGVKAVKADPAAAAVQNLILDIFQSAPPGTGNRFRKMVLRPALFPGPAQVPQEDFRLLQMPSPESTAGQTSPEPGIPVPARLHGSQAGCIRAPFPQKSFRQVKSPADIVDFGPESFSGDPAVIGRGTAAAAVKISIIRDTGSGLRAVKKHGGKGYVFRHGERPFRLLRVLQDSLPEGSPIELVPDGMTAVTDKGLAKEKVTDLPFLQKGDPCIAVMQGIDITAAFILDHSPADHNVRSCPAGPAVKRAEIVGRDMVITVHKSDIVSPGRPDTCDPGLQQSPVDRVFQIANPAAPSAFLHGPPDDRKRISLRPIVNDNDLHVGEQALPQQAVQAPFQVWFCIIDRDDH